MMFTSPISKAMLAASAMLILLGCKSDAERADEYFQSGMELLETGETQRALVQFRNVFEFDRSHLPTRQAMAELFMEQGNTRGAYGQYLAIVEQYPDEFEARRALTELAFTFSNWDEFERHGKVVVEANMDDPRVQAIDIGLKYRTAVLDEDDPARQALVTPAEALLEPLPESHILNNLLIDSYVRDGSLHKALERMDVMLLATPDDRSLYNRRLSILAQLQDTSEVESQLRDMVERFPADNEVQGMMLRYYLSQQKTDEAENFLREISDPSDEDPGLYLSLISFIAQTKGEEAARVEIERGIAESPKPAIFRSMLAQLDFRGGKRDEAISAMEAILEDADPNEPESQAIKTNLAKMLVATGNQVGARRLVEEVLTQNPSNVDALKMQSRWQLDVDETDEAIANLRLALDTAPDDVQVMNMMYEAYMRVGDPNLAREFLALAVDASGNAPETSLRYARLLMQEERFLPAEDVLLPALRQNPQNTELLTLLGQLYMQMDDAARATQVVDTLRRIDTDQSISLANGLQAELLSREAGTEEALQFLEGLASDADAGLREQLFLMNARLQAGETEQALAMAKKMVADNPDNLNLKQALAAAQAANGDLDATEVTLREITAAAPKQAVRSWMQLVQITRRNGDMEQVRAVVDEAIAATDNNANLMWAKATLLEQDGDVDGAIAIYESLYAQNSGNVIIANNLASLLATYKDDEQSLERAWVVGRRLKDADVPALQDTYGWILFRRGQVDEALPYLESAATGLEDAIVQAHLGFAYAALERNQDALKQMRKAVEIAGPADTRDKVEAARAEITRLQPLVEN